MLGYEGATELPLDTPAPLMCYGPDEVDVFTGEFAYGSRADCEREVAARHSTLDRQVQNRKAWVTNVGNTRALPAVSGGR